MLFSERKSLHRHVVNPSREADDHVAVQSLVRLSKQVSHCVFGGMNGGKSCRCSDRRVVANVKVTFLRGSCADVQRQEDYRYEKHRLPSTRFTFGWNQNTDRSTVAGRSALQRMDDLCVACKTGDLDTVKKLVEGGAGVNDTGETGTKPLHAVYNAASSHLTLVQWLVSQGATVGAMPETMVVCSRSTVRAKVGI